MTHGRSLFTCVLLLALSHTGIAGQGRAISIDDLLSAPIPDAPVAAANAPVIAWVGNERGVRNAWVARAPDFTPRRVTAYGDDDGQLLTALQLSADGTRLAFVRGSNVDAGGQASNPDSDPDGSEQAVWVVATDGAGEPKRVARGRSLLFSPRGDALVVQGGGIACHAVPGGGNAPAWCRESMLTLKGSHRAVAFSPDGNRLAFVSTRGDHAFVGVLDLASRAVRWMAPDFARDSAPAWSADGRRIAFLRVAGDRPGDTANLTTTRAFEVWIADAATGQARRLHRTNEQAGGFVQGVIAEPLRFSGDGRVLFASEADGWLRWYALSADAPDGSVPAPLSRGSCETDGIALAADGGLVFSGNCDDIEHRQLYAVDAQAGPQRRLTATDAIASDPLLLDDGRWIAFRHADARQPTAIAVLARDGGQPRRVYPATLPQRFPLDALVVPQTIRLRAADGLELHAQLLMPPDGHPGKRPALLYVHGGPIRQMLPGWHPIDYYYHDYANWQWLANQGYVVLALNFRAGTGYGQAFRRAAGQGPRGASEYQDVLAAHAHLAAMEQVDPTRIGIYGGSYGGYLTSLALARDSRRFAVGVDRHGVHDWREAAKGGDATALWNLQPGELETAGQSSPMSRIDDWRSPVLVIHGDDDPQVLFNQSTNLVGGLRDRGVPVETLVLPGEHHFFLRHASWVQVLERSGEFLGRHLNP